MIGREDVQRVKRLLKRNADYRFFFDELESPDWLLPLADEGLFDEPPEPAPTDLGLRFFPWPASRYLARVAGTAPEAAASVIASIPETANPMVRADLLAAVAAMPVDLSVQFQERILLWVSDGSWWGLKGPVFDLVESWMEAGETAGAVDVAARYLGLPHDAESASAFLERYSREQSDYELEDGLTKLLSVSPDRGVLEVLDRLETALDAATQVNADSSGDGGWFDSIWHPSIEPSSQDRHYDARSHLVDAVRDLAERAGSVDPSLLAGVVSRYTNQGTNIFLRLAIHICRRFPESLAEPAAAFVADRDVFDSHAVRHEYYWLVNQVCTRENQQVLDAYLRMIDDGPAASLSERFDDHPEAPAPLEYWTRDRLAPVADQLPTCWLERFDRLVDKYGASMHPDFLSYVEPVRFVGSESPLSTDEILNMDTDQLSSYLAEFVPSGDFGDPSIEGLGSTLTLALASGAEDLPFSLDAVKGSEPTYARCVLDGLRTAVEAQKAIDWSSALDLIAWVLEQRDEQEPRSDWSRDPDWSWARKSATSLIGAGLENERSLIPPDYISQAWELTKSLCADSQPSPEYEEQYGGSNMGPLSLALNTIRGYSFLNIMRLLELGRNEEYSDRVESFRPDILETLARHLDPALEPSLGVRAAYGWGLGTLQTCCPGWLEAHLDEIFPISGGLSELGRAAFEAFLYRWRPSTRMLDLLGDVYRAAIRDLEDTDDAGQSPDERMAVDRLVGHLLSYYWWGLIGDQSADLWETVLNSSSEAMRVRLAQNLARSLQGAPDASKSVYERSKAYVDGRLAAIAGGVDASDDELSAIASLVSVADLEPVWRLHTVTIALEHCSHIDPPRGLCASLLEVHEELPTETLRVLRLMFKRDRWGRSLLIDVAELDALLTSLLASQNQGVATEAAELVDWLVAAGYSNFAELRSIDHQ